MSHQFPARRGYVSVAVEDGRVLVMFEDAHGRANMERSVSPRVALDLGDRIIRAAQEAIAEKAEAGPMSTDEPADLMAPLRASLEQARREREYDRIDRLVDEDPIALRDLAWKLLDERDAAILRVPDVSAAEARGYRKGREEGYRDAIERLLDRERRQAWLNAQPDGVTLMSINGVVAYLEATEGDDRG